MIRTTEYLKNSEEKNVIVLSPLPSLPVADKKQQLNSKKKYIHISSERSQTEC